MEVLGILKLTTNTTKNKSQSTGREFTICTAVVETIDRYPKQVAVTCMDNCHDAIKKYKPGSLVRIQVDADSHLFNGKWFTELRAWRVSAGIETKEAQAASAETEPQPEPEGHDDTFFSQQPN